MKTEDEDERPVTSKVWPITYDISERQTNIYFTQIAQT